MPIYGNIVLGLNNEIEASLRGDIQTALTIIGRRNVIFDHPSVYLNLSNTDLRRIAISGINHDANLIEVNLSRVNLNRTNLRDANLNHTNLSDTDINEPTLAIPTSKQVIGSTSGQLRQIKREDKPVKTSNGWPVMRRLFHKN